MVAAVFLASAQGSLDLLAPRRRLVGSVVVGSAECRRHCVGVFAAVFLASAQGSLDLLAPRRRLRAPGSLDLPSIIMIIVVVLAQQ